MMSLLTQQGIHGLASIEILKVGCGTGANLVELMFLRAQPERPAGNELLSDQLDRARRCLPGSVRFYPENEAGRISWKRVTLVPFLARRAVRLHSSLYAICNAVPFLRTHILCFIEKT